MKNILFLLLGVILLYPILIFGNSITIEHAALTPKISLIDTSTDKVKDGKNGKIIVYPNPVDKILYLGLKSGFSFKSHALLTTLSGNVIAQLFPSAMKNQISFDLTNVPNGTYLIISKSNTEHDALQVVVQHN